MNGGRSFRLFVVEKLDPVVVTVDGSDVRLMTQVLANCTFSLRWKIVFAAVKLNENLNRVGRD
jgi:hypothetical protein